MTTTTDTVQVPVASLATVCTNAPVTVITVPERSGDTRRHTHIITWDDASHTRDHYACDVLIETTDGELRKELEKSGGRASLDNTLMRGTLMVSYDSDLLGGNIIGVIDDMEVAPIGID